jgi:hypothetical protein
MDEKTLRRFWAKVNKNGRVVRPELGPCWEWLGGTAGSRPYARMKVSGRDWRVSRLVHEHFTGPLVAGMFACHRCDNTICVNPDHVFADTAKGNSVDMVRKGRQAIGDRNGARLHPESQARGDRHWTRRQPERVRGKNNGRAKLTEGDVRNIRNLAASGTTNNAIARQFGVSNVLVGLIVRGKVWMHVSP